MQIPRYAYDSPKALDMIKGGLPVVLSNGCPLVAKATDWSFERLSELVLPSFEVDVYVSKTNRFMYHDASKNSGKYVFEPPTRKEALSFNQFLSAIASREEKDGGNEWHYLQTGVVAEMGAAMVNDYVSKFDLEYALLYKTLGEWDGFTSNLLLCGPQGAVTPLHFDEQQNMFAQLHGHKRVRLFPPEAFPRLYPHPMTHPCDRQSQVTLPATPGSLELEREEDRQRFPAFAADTSPEHAESFADLGPGDVLFVPQYWWHQMEALTNNTSLSWWYKDTTKASRAVRVDAATGSTVVDPAAISLSAVRRNIENLVAVSVPDAHWFFLALASGVIDFQPSPSPPPLPLATGGEGQGQGQGQGQGEGEGEAWEPLAADAAQADAVRAHASPDWPLVLEQALATVRHLPFLAERGKAKAFLRELVRGRFNAFTLKADAAAAQGGAQQA